MKEAARKIVEKILWSQVKRLRSKNKLTVVAVAGSTGKTSTKLAIAQTLEAKYKVRYQTGNYNVPVSVPLVFFGQPLPSLFNPIAWLKLFLKNESAIRRKYEYDIVIVELGTDQPGELNSFIPRLAADIGILTSIAPEHMEFFKTVDAVAKEELTIAKLSKKFIYNKDLCEPKYILGIEAKTYGIKEAADLRLDNLEINNGIYNFSAKMNNQLLLKGEKDVNSFQQLYSLGAAILTGIELGMTPDEIKKGIQNVKPVSGRMQKLAGINNSTIIDDTYNASPQAVLAALDTLYGLPASYKFAVLGNMNELGDYSERAHTEVGEYCNPKELNLVITIGPDSNKYLAPAAEKSGCKVVSFDDPYSAGEYLKSLIKEGSLILFKGSQNKVFAEEAIKSVLANSEDSAKLVRQSPYWMKKKKTNFGLT